MSDLLLGVGVSEVGVVLELNAWDGQSIADAHALEVEVVHDGARDRWHVVASVALSEDVEGEILLVAKT